MTPNGFNACILVNACKRPTVSGSEPNFSSVYREVSQKPWRSTQTSNSLLASPDWRMMDCRVPVLISVLLGTGTVSVVWSRRSCITTWLPSCRTSTKPFRVRIAQTYLPEKTPSLPNSNLKSRDVQLIMQALLNFSGRCRFKKQFYCLAQIGRGFVHRCTLAGYINL